MEKVFQAETTATADELFTVVGDLATYPEWIELVHRVEPITPTTTGDGASADPEWWVTLRAQIGPFARSKRLRMARTVHIPPSSDPASPGQVRFERSETDGRDHAAWTMEVTVVALDGVRDNNKSINDNKNFLSRADCRLHYGGSLWTGPLDGQLDNTARRSARSLQDLAASRSR